MLETAVDTDTETIVPNRLEKLPEYEQQAFIQYRQVLDRYLPADMAKRFYQESEDIALQLAATAPSEFRQDTKDWDRYQKCSLITLGLFQAVLIPAAIRCGFTPEQYKFFAMATIVSPFLEEVVYRGLPARLINTLKNVFSKKPMIARFGSSAVFSAIHTPKNTENISAMMPMSPEVGQVNSPFSSLLISGATLTPFLQRALRANFNNKLAGEDGVKRSIISHSLWNSVIIGTYMLNELCAKAAPGQVHLTTNTGMAAVSLLAAASMYEGAKEVQDELLVREYVEGLKMANSLSELKVPLGKMKVKADKLLSKRNPNGYKYAQGVLLTRLITELEVAEYTPLGKFRQDELERKFREHILATVPKGLSPAQLEYRMDCALKVAGFRETTKAPDDYLLKKALPILRQCSNSKELNDQGIYQEQIVKQVACIFRLNPFSKSEWPIFMMYNPFESPKNQVKKASEIMTRLLKIKASEFTQPNQKFTESWCKKQLYAILTSNMPKDMRLKDRAKYVELVDSAFHSVFN